MNIGIVCYPTYGGSGVVATELGLALARRGHRIHFISTAIPFRLESLGFVPNVTCHEVEMFDYPLFEHQPYTLALTSRIHQVAEEFELDVIHAHYAIPNGSAAWLAAQVHADNHDGMRPAVIITTHGTDITLVGREPSFHPVVRHALRKSDAVTSVSHWLKLRMDEEFNVNRDVEIIYNFIDPKRFRPGPEPELRSRFAEPGEFLILHISNFRPVKRVEDVVRAFARVAAHVPARLLMIGDGPDREKAARLARQLGVSDRMQIPGKQERVEPFLRMADVFVLPSEHESFGLAALESLSSGVPVVASTGGGLPEVIHSGVTGFLRPVGDYVGMAEDLLTLATAADLRAVMGRAARADVTARFSEEALVTQYEELYRRTVTKMSD